jgi:hypothetical protein
MQKYRGESTEYTLDAAIIIKFGLIGFVGINAAMAKDIRKMTADTRSVRRSKAFSPKLGRGVRKTAETRWAMKYEMQTRSICTERNAPTSTDLNTAA